MIKYSKEVSQIMVNENVSIINSWFIAYIEMHSFYI